MADAVAWLTSFGRALRDEGLPVTVDRIAVFCKAAALLAPDDLYWAGRATLVSRPEHIRVYDCVFARFFHPLDPTPLLPRQAVRPLLEPVELALASRHELLRRRSFADCSAAELDELAALMAWMPPLAPLRRVRRRELARRGTPDLRRTFRRASRTSGEPFERILRRPRQRRRRLVLVLDVSGSMQDYARGFLLFTHATVRTTPRTEVFCFGTRLTRLTRALDCRDVDDALRRAATEVFDWEGGTRIGESLRAFLDEFGHRGLARGAVVAICSDGLDVGDPDVLRVEMERLSRLAYRVVWLNPLKAIDGYAPLARGMQAALPYVDIFASGHNVASLELLAVELASLPGAG